MLNTPEAKKDFTTTQTLRKTTYAECLIKLLKYVEGTIQCTFIRFYITYDDLEDL